MILNRLEQYAVNGALVMFLLLCALSRFDGHESIIVGTRNVLFLVAGVAGMLISSQLADLHATRLAASKKRTILIARTLLMAFSLVITLYSLLELGILTGLTRWD